MASQPLNTTIQVFRSVRCQRRANWPWESVKNLTGHLRPLEIVVPGEENRTAVLTRDSSSNSLDFSSFMGEAAATATRGFPIVVGPVTAVEIEAMESFTGVDFPVEIGGDRFLTNTSGTVATRDLHDDIRDNT